MHFIYFFLLAEPNKRTRSHSKGHFARQTVADSGQKLKIGHRRGELRVHGKNAKRFGTEIGIIIRHHAPLQCSGWKAVPKEDKEALFARVQVYLLPIKNAFI